MCPRLKVIGVVNPPRTRSMRMARRPHGSLSRGIVIVARAKCADTRDGTHCDEVFDEGRNRISAWRGGMRARMRGNAGLGFFTDFRWKQCQSTRCNRFVCLIREAVCGLAGAADRAGMPGSNAGISCGNFLERAVYGNAQCAASLLNSARPPSNAACESQGDRAFNADCGAGGNIDAGDTHRPGAADRTGGSRARSAACPGAGYSLIAARFSRDFATLEAPRPIFARRAPPPDLARVARYRPTFASGGAARSTAARPHTDGWAGARPAAERIGARDRHGGEHACQKNIGSWYWTTIRKCAPG